MPVGPAGEKDRVKGILAVLCCGLLALTGGASAAPETDRPLTQQERDFFASSITPALLAIKHAMPAAPEGWAREDVAVSDTEHPGIPAEDIANFHFTHAVTYRRTAGVAEETARLQAAAAEIMRRHTEAAEARLQDLKAKRAETEKAVHKAHQRRETGREGELRKQLDEIAKGIDAVPEERDRKIREETDPLIVRDTVLEVRVTVNESAAEYPDLKSFSRPKAAFALRRDGEREGPLGWKTGRTVILYGDWQEVKNNSFRLRMEPRPFSSRAQSLLIAVAGDRSRAEQFLRRTDLRSILDLMK